jgi:hypothetical protein
MMRTRLVVGSLVLAGMLLGGCMLFNNDPVASFTWTQVKDTLTGKFDASGSYDPDGEIVSYAWDFGGLATTQGPKVEYAFPDSKRSYQVELSVVDNKGAIGCVTKTVYVENPPPVIKALEVKNLSSPSYNQHYVCNWIRVTVSAVDPAGIVPVPSPPTGEIRSIVIHSGDGRSFQGPTAEFFYKQPGCYTIRAVVTDAKGASVEATKDIVISVWHPVPPEANIKGIPSAADLNDTISVSINAWSPNVHGTWCLPCNPCPPEPCKTDNHGIQRINVVVEDPCGYVKVYEVECQHYLAFNVKFDIAGEWEVRGVVWDDGRPESLHTTFSYSIKVG